MTFTKHDGGKPRLDLIPRAAVEAMGRAFTYGAAKYTRYGECTCDASMGATERSTLGGYAAPVTTGISSDGTQNTGSGNLRTSGAGRAETRSGSPCTGRGATSASEQTLCSENGDVMGGSRGIMGCPVSVTSNSSPVDAQSAVASRGYASITATPLESSGAHSAIPVISGSVSSSDRTDGLKNHSPTCGARKIVVSGAGNWRLCDDPGRYVAATLRHLFAWNEGERTDPESGLSHLDHAIASLAMLIGIAEL